MTLQRRKIIISALVMPAGCSVQALKPLISEPIATPSVVPLVRAPALGQTWTYHRLDIYNSKLLAVEREQVATVGPRIILKRQSGAGQVLPEEHHLGWGQMVRDPVWDVVQNYEDAVSHWPDTLQPGASKQVNTHYLVDQFSYRFWINVRTTAQAWERVRVPAGTFDALRIEKLIRIQHQDEGRVDAVRRDIVWLAPETGRWVAREIRGEYKVIGTATHDGYETSCRWELTAWA